MLRTRPRDRRPASDAPLEAFGRAAGTCPDAPPRRGHPRDHNRVPRHVVVRSETAYGRQLLGERFCRPAVAVGRPLAEARAWKPVPSLRPASLVQSCAKVPSDLCNPPFAASPRCATAIDQHASGTISFWALSAHAGPRPVFRCGPTRRTRRRPTPRCVRLRPGCARGAKLVRLHVHTRSLPPEVLRRG